MVALDPHQIKAYKELHNGCILKGGVGTGKSRVALAYFVTKECGGSIDINGFGTYAPMRTPKDIYIITTAKKRDKLEWEEEAAGFALSTNKDISLSGVKVTVDSWNNILNYREVKDAFFVFDEQRLVGAGAWVKAFLDIAKTNNWIMLSATPGDTWMDYIPVFVANGFYKNRAAFIRDHVVFRPFIQYPQIDRYVGTGKLESLRRRVLVEMPFHMHTKRHVENVIVEFNEELFKRAWVERWHVYEDRPIKDVGELYRVVRKIVNSDPSRLGAVMQLMEKHPRLIIFYNFDYELEALRVLARTLDVPVAEWNGHKHQEIPDTKNWLYLVQYTAGAEGWNCITTDAMVLFSLNYSYKVFEQVQGRTDRINTPFIDLWYYVLRSISPIDNAIAKSIATKKNFNEKDFAKQSGIVQIHEDCGYEHEKPFEEAA